MTALADLEEQNTQRNAKMLKTMASCISFMAVRRRRVHGGDGRVDAVAMVPQCRNAPVEQDHSYEGVTTTIIALE
mgnify:CR=1 FL=1